MAVSSCQEEEYGPSVFEITEQTYGTELFAYGAEKQFALTSENIKVNYVKCIKGRRVGTQLFKSSLGIVGKKNNLCPKEEDKASMYHGSWILMDEMMFPQGIYQFLHRALCG